MPRPTVRVATAHLSPIILSPSATLTTILHTIRHAAAHHATLICFPESFLPGFPIWSALLPPAHPATHAFFAAFAEASIYADGPEIMAVRECARECGISVSLGFSEKARWSQGTLWNSNLIMDSKGEVRVHHRKLQPTFYERLSWGMGDGAGLQTVGVEIVPVPGGDGSDTANGRTPATNGAETTGPDSKQIPSATNTTTNTTVKIGALICGENTNPLARYSLIAQGEDIHISTWPAVWPTRLTDDTSTTTSTKPAATSKGKNYDNILANRLRAGAHCFEAKCHGIMCAAFLSESNITSLLDLLSSSSSSTSSYDQEIHASFERTLRGTSRAASMVLDPTGTPVVGFTMDADGNRTEREMLREEEGVLFADLNLDVGVEGKQYHDLVGGYQRLDVFELNVDRKRREVVNFRGLQ
jgi:nitrilase